MHADNSDQKQQLLICVIRVDPWPLKVWLLSEPPAIFTRDKERLHHFRLFEVAAKLVQLIEPELVATFIRVTTEIPEVFHHYKRRVALRVNESFVLHYLTERRGPCQCAAIEPVDQGLTISVEAVSVR